MAGFSADWLALREPADHAARSAAVTRAVVDALPRDRTLRILDLAAGTGSNLRYLTNHLTEATSADWLLVDHEPALLAQVPETSGVHTRDMDLASSAIARSLTAERW
jgi:ubiquinone/menaquinone biosynthesis C-methylase UbiE